MFLFLLLATQHEAVYSSYLYHATQKLELKYHLPVQHTHIQTHTLFHFLFRIFCLFFCLPTIRNTRTNTHPDSCLLCHSKTHTDEHNTTLATLLHPQSLINTGYFCVVWPRITDKTILNTRESFRLYCMCKIHTFTHKPKLLILLNPKDQH